MKDNGMRGLVIYVVSSMLLVASFTMIMSGGGTATPTMFLRVGENVTYVCAAQPHFSSIFFYKYREVGKELTSLLRISDIVYATFKLDELSKKGLVDCIFSWEVEDCNETLCRVKLAYTIRLRLNRTYRLTVVEHAYVDKEGHLYYEGRYVGIWPFKLPEYKLYEGASIVIVGKPAIKALKPLTKPVKLTSVVKLNTSQTLHVNINRDVVERVKIDPRRLLVATACLDIYDPSRVSRPAIQVVKRILPSNCTVKQYNFTKYYEEVVAYANALWRKYTPFHVRFVTGSPEILHMVTFVYDVETGYAVAFASTTDYAIDVFANIFHLSDIDADTCPLYIMLRKPTSHAMMGLAAPPYLVPALIMLLFGLTIYAAKKTKKLVIA